MLLAGAPFEDRAHPGQHGALHDVDGGLLARVPEPAAPASRSQVGEEPGRRVGRRRWAFMRLPGESVDDMNRVDTAWRLLAPWNVTPSNATLERHTVYRFEARWVDGWRRGPFLLAGDAAHQMP